jgi:hypothetical protein
VAIHKTHHNDSCIGYWPEDAAKASAAIAALRDGAVQRVEAMHANKYGTACSVVEAEGFIEGVLGCPPSTHKSDGLPGSTVSAAETILTTTARALRCAASWLSNDGDRATVNEVAQSVETAEATDESLGDICPVCQEVLCDDDCPLEPVRREFN